MMRTIWVIGLSLLLGLLLTILPLPVSVEWARPLWVYLILLYWMMSLPSRVGIGLAWGMGMLMDLLTGTLLGQHAFVFSVVAYFLIRFHPQVKHFPLLQQSLMVGLLVMLNLALQYWVQGFVGAPPITWQYWLPALTTPLVWPWVQILLSESQRRFLMPV